MKQDVKETKDFYQLVQTRDTLQQLRQALDRMEEALERGDYWEADTWRLQARPRMKALQSWTRAAVAVLQENDKPSA
jgi:hypothetical protein